LLAMVANDDAYPLGNRGILETIVGTPPGASSLLQGNVFFCLLPEPERPATDRHRQIR